MVRARRVGVAALAAATFWMAAPAGARAWGYDGHRVVAAIAESRLTPTALSEVRKLLATDRPRPHRSLREIASWADYARLDDPDGAHAAWHYVAIPVDAAGHGTYRRERDCPSGDCIVEALRSEISILADRSPANGRRLIALLWITHLVGDLHQVLHIADQGDRNGLKTAVADYCAIVPECPPTGEWRNLHHLWDDGLVLEDLRMRGAVDPNGRPLPDQLAGLLAQKIDPADAAAWSAGAPEEWANETIARAAPIAYPAVPLSTGPLPAEGSPPAEGPLPAVGRRHVALGNAYVAAAVPTVEQELEIAGVRLAQVLNAALDPNFRNRSR